MRLVVSAEIEQEYADIISRSGIVRLFARHGVAADEYLDVLRGLLELAERVVPTGEAPPCRDEKDRKYLHCALASGVDYLVSYDQDLLTLGQIGPAAIVSPGTFLAAAEQSGQPLEP